MVSGEERQKILDDIEALFRSQRPQAQAHRPGKRLNGLALPMAANAVAIVFVAACILAFVLYITRFQIRPEERALQRIFGEAFSAYCARVRRWL